MLDYVTIHHPMTFEDILKFWIGEDDYAKMLAYNTDDHREDFLTPESEEWEESIGRIRLLHGEAEAQLAASGRVRIVKSEKSDPFNDYISTIRSVENQLYSALINGHIHLFNQRIAAGRELYYKVQYNQAELFAGTCLGYGEKLHKCFQFMIHSGQSTPLYFDSVEIFNTFPFLKTVQTASDKEAPAAGDEERTPVNVPASLWAGKPHGVAFDNLQGKFADEVIAYILVKKMKCINKTEAGRLFSKRDEYGVIIEMEDVSFRRIIDSLIEKCEQKYIITFNE